MNKITWAAVAALAVLLGGCAAPSERPGQASPTPTPTSSETAPATTTPAFAGEAPVNNWVDLIRVHPEVKADLIEAGWTEEQIVAQAAIRTSGDKTPIATVKVAFGNAPGGDLRSTGACKASSGTCPTNALIEGLLPLVETEGEPLMDPSRGVLVGFTADNNPFVLKDLTLKKR